MVEEATDRRSQILEAAFEEFAVKGFRGATIKSIAAEAGLQSPALIYHYFPDKEALFREILEARAPVIQAVIEPEHLMDLPPEKVLRRLGLAYLAFDQTNTKDLRLVIGQALHRPEVAEIFIEDGPGRVLDFLKDYLAHQVEKDRLRPHDVRSSARAFIGMLIPQVMGNVLFPTLAKDGLSDETHLETTIEIFLKGLEPEG